MSKMADLDAELRAAGIDPEEVDLEAVEAYIQEAHPISTRDFILAMKVMYSKHVSPDDEANFINKRRTT
jgi:hypothetical protein